MKQYNYKCVVTKNSKRYYKKVSGKWKRITNKIGEKMEKGKKKYNFIMEDDDYEKLRIFDNETDYWRKSFTGFDDKEVWNIWKIYYPKSFGVMETILQNNIHDRNDYKLIINLVEFDTRLIGKGQCTKLVSNAIRLTVKNLLEKNPDSRITSGAVLISSQYIGAKKCYINAFTENGFKLISPEKLSYKEAVTLPPHSRDRRKDEVDIGEKYKTLSEKLKKEGRTKINETDKDLLPGLIIDDLGSNYVWEEQLEFTRDPAIPFKTELHTSGLSPDQLYDNSTYTIKGNPPIIDTERG